MINGIELEGLEQIQTFKTFDYSDNIFLNPITLVNNSVINFGNGFINTWNSAVSTYQYINKNGWGAYGSELGSQTKDAFSGIGNYFSSGYKYIRDTPLEQQFTETLQAFGKAENYENFATLATSALLTKNFSLPKVDFSSQAMQRTLAARGAGLSDDVAKTFQFGRYTEVTLDKPLVLSRYYDNLNAFAKGRFMTNSTSGFAFLDRMGMGIRPSWNGMTKVAHWEIPAGSTIYQGRAAMQFPWLGGKTQYFVPNLENIVRVTR